MFSSLGIPMSVLSLTPRQKKKKKKSLQAREVGAVLWGGVLDSVWEWRGSSLWAPLRFSLRETHLPRRLGNLDFALQREAFR